ncbi:MAG: phosphoribosylanthranilate isomerase [Candidatus Omnitrophica bacterium]|nr:phosphoribosylanthranilate isomerase [Candidatus Omnitrophota bacterium]
MTKIKICGITNQEDAQGAVDLGADAIGFVFAESPRKVDPKKARSIIKGLKGSVLKVGVFVNEDLSNIERIAGNCSLDALQLHGDENPLFCSKLLRWKVIKAFRIKDEKSLKPITDYKDIFACLLDTYSKEAYGGTGKTFDWGLALKARSLGIPMILSGGLSLYNIEEAIKAVRPYGVDISSSIELIPGKKDKKLMERIISIIKALD